MIGKWPLYWNTDLRSEHKQTLESRLKLETTEGHPLYGMEVEALASGDHPDDVVFALSDGRYAIVHLMWHDPVSADLPYTTIWETLDDLWASEDWG